MTFDPTKPVQTRDGRPAEIVYTFPDGSLLAVIDKDSSYRLNSHGRYWGGTQTSKLDLVNIPPAKHKSWVNFYNDNRGYAYTTREKADVKASTTGRIACKEVEWYEGEGL
jgi:hypothetical protein